MKSTTLLFERRASRFALAALLGTSLLAACNEDRPLEPVAPIPTAAPTTPSAERKVSTGTLAWTVVDANTKSLLFGAKFQVTGGPQNFTWTFTDNTLPDTDPAIGRFKLASLATGSYKVCEIGAPAGYMLPASCKTENVFQNYTSNLTPFENWPLPFVTAEYFDYGKTFIGGGTMSIKDTLGNTLMTVVDDGALDGDKTPGKFKITMPALGTFQLCETAPPPRYLFPAYQVVFCEKIYFNGSGSTHRGPYLVVPPFSAVWSTIDGFHDPFNQPGWIGPASFRITNADSTYSRVVAEGSLDDMHPMTGIMHTRLPASGVFTVCQVTQIPGYWLPNPRCKTITVVQAVVLNAGFFINPEAQVPSP